MSVHLCSHLSWGALLHGFDDGDSVSFFQGKAIASITGSYLDNNMSHISKISSHQTKTFLQSANTHTRQKKIAAQTDSRHSTICSLL